jgi:hypothetical protein
MAAFSGFAEAKKEPSPDAMGRVGGPSSESLKRRPISCLNLAFGNNFHTVEYPRR